MPFEVQRVLHTPEGTFRQKAPDYLQDPGFIAWQGTHGTGGTYPEYLVWWWLTHKAGAEEGRDFWYQISFGGGRQGGGFVADYVIEPPIVTRQMWLEVYGTAFHTAPVRRGPESLALDQIREEFALHNHYDFVRVLDTDLVNRLDYTMSNALLDIEIAVFAA